MSLTQNEVVALLKVATAYDGRQRGQADVFAWTDSAARAAWTYEEALEAVKEHFAFDGGFLTPAVVTKGVTAQREAKERHRRELQYSERRAELEGPPPDVPPEPERIRSIVEEIAGRMGWQRAPRPMQQAMRVQCPNEGCGAAPGVPCARKVARGPRRGEYMRLANCHESRIEAARRAA